MRSAYALHSDSCAVGTARSNSQTTLGQMLHADNAAFVGLSAASAVGMVNGSKKRRRNNATILNTWPYCPARVASDGVVQNSAPSLQWMINFTASHRDSVYTWFLNSEESKNYLKQWSSLRAHKSLILTRKLRRTTLLAFLLASSNPSHVLNIYTQLPISRPDST